MKTLKSTMDNLDAYRLGDAARKAAQAPAGDLIDTGLILRRMLDEAGYHLVKKENM